VNQVASSQALLVCESFNLVFFTGRPEDSNSEYVNSVKVKTKGPRWNSQALRAASQISVSRITASSSPFLPIIWRDTGASIKTSGSSVGIGHGRSRSARIWSGEKG
jgi:hypothetical protein